MREPQNVAKKGSQRDLQCLVNQKPNLFEQRLKTTCKGLVNDEIIFVSPLENDEFAEYRDDGFLEKIGLSDLKDALKEFWPDKGPQWDALAKTCNEKVILVEAKANIPELKSNCEAKAEKSQKKIAESLRETKQYLGVTDDSDWTREYYQYANRLAHLYFLREKYEKDAFLVNVYFIGDDTVSGPKTKAEWNGALQVLYKYLELPTNHKLKQYCIDIYIDIAELKCSANAPCRHF